MEVGKQPGFATRRADWISLLKISVKPYTASFWIQEKQNISSPNECKSIDKQNTIYWKIKDEDSTYSSYSIYMLHMENLNFIRLYASENTIYWNI